MFQPLPPPGPATAELSTGWSGALTLPVCDRCKRICVQAMRANSTMAAAITIAVVVRCSASLDGARGADVGVALPARVTSSQFPPLRLPFQDVAAAIPAKSGCGGSSAATHRPDARPQPCYGRGQTMAIRERERGNH